MIVFVKLIKNFREAAFPSDLGAHLLAESSKSWIQRLPMSNLSMWDLPGLPKVGVHFVLYAGERLYMHAMLVASTE